MTFEEAVDGVAELLDQLFPPEVTIIAEPGRFFCTSCYTLAVTIISRRDRFVVHSRPQNKLSFVGQEDGHQEQELPDKEDHKDEPESPVREVLYYLSDGLYGSFNNIVR